LCIYMCQKWKQLSGGSVFHNSILNKLLLTKHIKKDTKVVLVHFDWIVLGREAFGLVRWCARDTLMERYHYGITRSVLW